MDTYVAMIGETRVLSCEAPSIVEAGQEIENQLNRPGRFDVLKKWRQTGKVVVPESALGRVKLVQMWRPYKRDIDTGKCIMGQFFQTEAQVRKHAVTYYALNELIGYSNPNEADVHTAAYTAFQAGAKRVVIDLPDALNPGQYIFLREE